MSITRGLPPIIYGPAIYSEWVPVYLDDDGNEVGAPDDDAAAMFSESDSDFVYTDGNGEVWEVVTNPAPDPYAQTHVERTDAIVLSESRFGETRGADLEDKYADEPEAERFWGYGGAHMGSTAEQSYTKEYPEPFGDAYQRQLAADRLEREGPPPSDDEMGTLVRQFGMNSWPR